MSSPFKDITGIIGSIPNRMAFAGGWIDQPFISRLNPDPPGSMVVVSLEPTFRVLDRAGMATSTRTIAAELWGGRIPAGSPTALVRELYERENDGKEDPSGSQDMIGLIYPGISRLDYDFGHEGGYFPVHIESCCLPEIAEWVEKVVHLVPVAQRPAGYNPLEIRNLDPKWIGSLGQSGRDCYDAIVRRDTAALGTSFNRCMECWEAILPCTVKHPSLTVDLQQLLACYQEQYTGAMYSGCGGGYLFVVSEEEVPGSLHVRVRTGRGQ